MCIFEFDEEKFLKSEREWAREEGRGEGRKEGRKEGHAAGCTETLIKNVETLMKNFSIDLHKACEGLGISIEEYENAKDKLSL